jgi:hypothetical protein
MPLSLLFWRLIPTDLDGYSRESGPAKESKRSIRRLNLSARNPETRAAAAANSFVPMESDARISPAFTFPPFHFDVVPIRSFFEGNGSRACAMLSCYF